MPGCSPLRRRDLLASAAAVLAIGASARASTIRGALPWRPNAGDPPVAVTPGGWRFFTPEEGALVEAIVDRLIPPDPQWAGGRDAGCAVFIDRQLAGPYGASQGLYMLPPFASGSPGQGQQRDTTPARTYRDGLRAVDAHVRRAYAGKTFGEIPAPEQDRLLEEMEKGGLHLEGADAHALFQQVYKDAMEGFFADPIYGGNRDMVSWRMIGFPGTRYDYRDWVDRHNERYPLPPVSLAGRPEWAER